MTSSVNEAPKVAQDDERLPRSMGYINADYSFVDISDLIEKTFIKIDVEEYEIIFHLSENEFYRMYHEQNCCESVIIEDVCGEIDWLIGESILKAEKRCSNEASRMRSQRDASETWTFYEIATIKGAVTIRWYGSSNGYYSEEVDIAHIRKTS